MPHETVIVWTACPDRHVAETIARHLVDQRLAACATMLPGATSIYRWKSAVETADEVVLMIKTRAAHLAEVEAAVEALHPYEVPEFLAVPVQSGAEPYLAWLAESTE
jgi:periplasmic divalent cation tolerance protein